MYTAKIKSKEIVNGIASVTVTFSDGTTTIDETCKPQDMDGFKYWVKSRLAAFNSVPDIQALQDGSEIDVSDPVVEPPTLTQAQIDERQWFADYAKWLRVKSNLVDTGVVPSSDTQVQALLKKVKDNFKASYLNDM